MLNLLEKFSQDVDDHWICKSVEIVANPNPFNFLKDFVCSHKPVIIQGSLQRWKALEWNLSELSDRVSSNISVNITADGRADAVNPETNSFIYPAESKMTMKNFYEYFKDIQSNDAIVYLSQQVISFL